MNKIKQIWSDFVGKHPKLADWVREGGLFILVSNGITLIRGILVTLLEPAFGFLGHGAVGFPNIILNLFGIEFSWYIIGASEKQGGAAYFASFIIALWVCEIINFFLQRKFVFRSNGNMGRQAILYFLTFLVVTCVVNAVSNLWIGVASNFVPPFIYNLGTTFITGGVAMVVFFFANRFIFKETEKKA
jgi:putative flippase GtrA